MLVIYYQSGERNVEPTSFPFLSSTSSPTDSGISWRVMFSLTTYFMTQFSKHLSVFMNLALSFVRTYHVMCPGCRSVTRALITGTVGVFSVLVVVFLTTHLVYFVHVLHDITVSDTDTVQVIVVVCLSGVCCLVPHSQTGARHVTGTLSLQSSYSLSYS